MTLGLATFILFPNVFRMHQASFAWCIAWSHILTVLVYCQRICCSSTSQDQGCSHLPSSESHRHEVSSLLILRRRMSIWPFIFLCPCQGGHLGCLRPSSSSSEPHSQICHSRWNRSLFRYQNLSYARTILGFRSQKHKNFV